MCTYCLEAEQDFAREKMTMRAQDAVLKFVQKNIYKYNGIHVSWFGGEPLLETSIIKYLSENLIQICKARCIPYSAQTTTNGFFLDSDVFGALYKQRVYTFMITVDGFRDQHDKYRCMHNGAGTYDTIMRNLINIRDNKQYKFANITIRINITRDVLDVIDDFIEYIDSLFSNDPRFTFLFIPVTNYSSTKPAEDVFVNDEEVSARLNNNQIYLNKFLPDYLNMYLISHGKSCQSSLKNSYVIAPDLKVYKCCAHYDMEDNCMGHIDLKGNLVLDEYLHGKWYLMNEFIKRKFDNCRDCYYMPACTNNGKNCPYHYLKNSKELIKCPLEIDGFVEKLTAEVLKAADNYPCYNVSF